MSDTKKEIDLSKQTCNYCKENGHRIHAMDAFGVYLSDCDGQRILACPILVAKKVKLQKTVEEEFPALSGGATSPSAATVGIHQSIENAKKEKRHQDWLDRQAQKEAKQRAWQERQRQKELEHVENMKIKYGPKWHWCVKDTTEDTSSARQLRDEWEEAEYRREEDDDAEADYRQKHAEREALRAHMTPQERWRDEDEENEDLEAAWEEECSYNEYVSHNATAAAKRQQDYYKEQGWFWDPRG